VVGGVIGAEAGNLCCLQVARPGLRVGLEGAWCWSQKQVGVRFTVVSFRVAVGVFLRGDGGARSRPRIPSMCRVGPPRGWAWAAPSASCGCPKGPMHRSLGGATGREGQEFQSVCGGRAGAGGEEDHQQPEAKGASRVLGRAGPS